MGSTDSLSKRAVRRISIAALCGVVLNFAWMRFQFFGSDPTAAFSDLIGIPAATAAATAALFAARGAAGRARRAWQLLAAGMLSWGVGEAIWTYYEVALKREVPFPSLADVGFLGMVPLAIAGMLMFPTAPRSAATRVRTLLDGLIIGGSMLFISWAVVLGDAYRAGDGGILAQAIGLAYPLGDLVIMACVFFVLWRAVRSERAGLWIMSLGLVSLALADSAFTYTTVHNVFTSSNLINPFWNLGFVLIALGALRAPKFTGARHDERRVGPGAIAAPYGPFLAAIGTAIFVQVTRGRLEPFLFWTAIAIIACLTVRQIAALIDNLSLNRDLEHRVRERTADLVTALAEVERSTKLQDEFVTNTSHELLTPLTVIMGSLDLLAQLDDTHEESSTFIDMAQRSSVRMKRLVQDVLLASGVVSELDCESVSVELHDEIRRAIDAVDVKRTVPSVEVDKSLAAVGDRERLRMVVQHLVSNAEKFAPEDSVIRVTAYTADGSVHVIVADDGPGIPVDQREAVFRRFYQTDGSVTRAHGGLGLGLFLARSLMHAMHGDLVIDDAEHGTQMHLTLPAFVEPPLFGEASNVGTLATTEREAGVA